MFTFKPKFFYLIINTFGTHTHTFSSAYTAIAVCLFILPAAFGSDLRVDVPLFTFFRSLLRQNTIRNLLSIIYHYASDLRELRPLLFNVETEAVDVFTALFVFIINSLLLGNNLTIYCEAFKSLVMITQQSSFVCSCACLHVYPHPIVGSIAFKRHVKLK